ncbi:hypothetical protein [Halocatena halophila]|uniref:hypothetical protein n=1 Tax=Halocatena halophila TaxID=2814576 RepID=UPI002ED63FE9
MNPIEDAQQNAQQILSEAEQSLDDDETVEGRALEAAQTHYETAIEQQQRAQQIAQTAAITVAIIEGIAKHSNRNREEENDQEEAIVEGVNDD